jgi:hypothetical protein
MAYQVVEDNLHTCPTCGPFGINLGLRYDPVTGEYQLKEQGLLGYDTPLTAIFYQDGSWAMDAIRDPQLFVDGDPNQPTPLTQSLSTLLRQKTQQAHVAIGGNAGGNNLHPTAQVSQHTAVPGVLNQFPGTNPGIATALPGGNILATPPGTSTDPTQIPATTAKAEEKLASSNKNFFTDTLRYPFDILELQQDFLKIEQLELSPSSTIFGDPGSVLKGGLSVLGGRTTQNKGRLYLPIPNNAADSNATAWGADQMNNLTASITAMMSNDVKSGLVNTSTVTGLLSAGLDMVAKFNPAQAVAIGRVVADAGGMDAIQGPLLQQVQASITSALLKQASFDVPAEQILARSGVVPNSNLELLFNNVTLREFTFSYRMSPRSSDEAAMVRKIILFFKKGMAAKKSNGQGSTNAGTFLKSPNIFRLTYQTGDANPISGMNKFQLCALTNFAVNYSPDGQFSAYDEGQPVSYNIGMSFSEIVPLYESDYDDPSSIGY